MKIRRNTKKNLGPHLVGDRSQAHKFIFEETIDAAKEVKLKVEAATAGKDILIANPYMAHLDFDKFYLKNSALIQPYYKVMENNYSYATYYTSGGSTGNPVMTKYIAPMQAILVTPKVPITAANSLVTTGDMTIQRAGVKLRMGKETKATSSSMKFIRVSVSDTKMRSRASLILDKTSNLVNTYDSRVDIMKTIKEGVLSYPTIYFITTDNKYTDIKTVKKVDGIVFKIGISCEVSGPMALGFENVNEFASDYYVYLVDKYENKEVLLDNSNPIYCFNKTTNKKFLDDRFELRFSKELSGIEEDNAAFETIQHKTVNNTLLVYTQDYSIIKDIMIYDLQGKLVANNKVDSETFNIRLPKGVYIVRATSNKTSNTFKVIIQ